MRAQAARTRYDAVVAAARRRLAAAASVRDAMRAWQFDQRRPPSWAMPQAILDQRTAIQSGALTAGLTPPDALRTAFERPDGFASATLEAKRGARRDRPVRGGRGGAPGRDRTCSRRSVSWGTSPEADLAQARMRFAAGDSAGAATAAASADAAWAGAEDLGRGRLVSVGLVALAAVFALVLLMAWLRGASAGGRGGCRRAGTVRYTRRHSRPGRHGPRSEGMAREARDRTDGADPLAAVARDPVGRLGRRLFRARRGDPRAARASTRS